MNVKLWFIAWSYAATHFRAFNNTCCFTLHGNHWLKRQLRARHTNTYIPNGNVAMLVYIWSTCICIARYIYEQHIAFISYNWLCWRCLLENMLSFSWYLYEYVINLCVVCIYLLWLKPIYVPMKGKICTVVAYFRSNRLLLPTFVLLLAIY